MGGTQFEIDSTPRSGPFAKAISSAGTTCQGDRDEKQARRRSDSSQSFSAQQCQAAQQNDADDHHDDESGKKAQGRTNQTNDAASSRFHYSWTRACPHALSYESQRRQASCDRGCQAKDDGVSGTSNTVFFSFDKATPVSRGRGFSWNTK
jgi:hypothetical protein